MIQTPIVTYIDYGLISTTNELLWKLLQQVTLTNNSHIGLLKFPTNIWSSNTLPKLECHK